MPPLLLKLVFDRIENAKMPFFAKPIAKVHRRQGQGRLRHAEHQDATSTSWKANSARANGLPAMRSPAPTSR